MKTKIFLLSLLVGFSAHIFAQETQVYESQTPGYKTNFKRNNAGDNWFINLSAGAQAYNLLHKADDVDFINRIGFIPAVSIGKWFSPYWGVRLKGQGWDVSSFGPKTTWRQHIEYFNVHLDAMWNLSNYWGSYSPTKLFNFTPYVGLGYAHRLESDQQRPGYSTGLCVPSTLRDFQKSSDALSVNPGIQFGFRLSKRVNLDFDLGATVVGDYFNRLDNPSESDVIFHAMGGFTFNLGKTTFEVVEGMDMNLINDLNGKINSLRKENDLLSKRPTHCPECPPTVPTPKGDPIVGTINYVPNVVFFRLNSSQVDANQQINIYNTAAFMKETGEKIKVIGYADKGTGTGKYNLSLSEKRAKAVAKELISKYKIPSERIIVEWKGSDVQPYSQNNWNRVVIMSAPK